MKKPTTKRKKVPDVVEPAPMPAPDAAESDAEKTACGKPRTIPVALRRKLGPLNPLFDLPAKTQLELFKSLRDGHREDFILLLLEEKGVTGVTPLQLTDYFQTEAQDKCELRLVRAAQEARALMNIVEREKAPFCPATLATLEQEIFRQLSSGETESGSIAKLGTLFLKVKGSLRADEMHGLRSEKMRRELQGQIDHAMERLASEVEKHPETRVVFETLREAMAASLTKAEESHEEN